MNEYPNGTSASPDASGRTPGQIPATDGFGIAALVLGILAVLGCCCGIGLPAGILAVIFAVVSRSRRASFSAMSLIGMICGILALAVTALLTVIIVLNLPLFEEALEEALREYSQESGYEVHLPDLYAAIRPFTGLLC